MKLTELDPRWITFGSAAENFKDKRWYLGLTFLCPHCREQRLAVFFQNEIDDGVRWAYETWDSLKMVTDGHVLWQREGDTFDTITLKPSIDVSFDGHWHGFITNGDIR
jgi:hypothetical protein